jgi:nicotinamidase-related amidase
MTSDLLLVIDVQKGFITDQTSHIPKLIQNLIVERNFEKVVFTQFVNTEGSFYESEIGWRGMYNAPDIDIVPELLPFVRNIFVKHGYTSFTKDLIVYLKQNSIRLIYMVGLETDACVLKSAIDALELGYRPIVLGNYCATTAGDIFHTFALDLLRKNVGLRNVQ